MKKKAKPAPKKKAASGNHDKALREHLVFLLKGGGAHVHFIDAVEGFPEAKRGTFIAGLPHTGWQLLSIPGSRNGTSWNSAGTRSMCRRDFPKAIGRRHPVLRMKPRGPSPLRRFSGICRK